MNGFVKNIGVWLIIAMIMVGLFNMLETPSTQGQQQIAFSSFLDKIESGEILEVVLRGNEMIGISDGQRVYQTLSPRFPDLAPFLEEHNVRVQVDTSGQNNLLGAFLSSWLPMLLIVGIWLFFLRQMSGGGNRAMSFGKIRLRSKNEDAPPTTFNDVAGIEESKEELKEIVEFLADPQRFEKLGGEIPRGVLLIGSPGTGKTLLAKAIAGEAGVPFFSISGSDFVEMFVGVGASRVRDLFEQGKKNSPCIIFIDEIDAVGRSRGAGLGGGNDEREQTLNQLLVEMDGFGTNQGVIVVAATNRPDVLDPALLRPGRFDRHVTIPRPDVQGREAILQVHTKNIELAEQVDLHSIARGTPGFTGADLANLVNEAALWAARKDKESVETSDFEYAKDKVLMGAERRSILISDEEKRTTAFHEAGHALVAANIPEVDPVHKVSIIPRGRALGVTQLLPTEEKYGYNRTTLLGQIAMTMGGRAAEDLVFQQYTTGASDDLKKATELAKKMVCQWGMSESLGPLSYSEDDSQVFLGRDMMRHSSFSDETAHMIDAEVKQILSNCYEHAKAILDQHRDALNRLAELLIEKETVDGSEIQALLTAE